MALRKLLRLLLAIALCLAHSSFCLSPPYHYASELIAEHARKYDDICNVHREAVDSMNAYSPWENCLLTRMESGIASKLKCLQQPRMAVYEFYKHLHDMNTSDYHGAYLYLHPRISRVLVLSWHRQQDKPVSASALCENLHHLLLPVSELESSSTKTNCLKFDISHVVKHFIRSEDFRDSHLVVVTENQLRYLGSELPWKPFLQVVVMDQEHDESSFCENGERVLRSTVAPISTTTRIVNGRRVRPKPKGRRGHNVTISRNN